MNFRSMFTSIFKKNPNNDMITDQYKMINGYENYFMPFDGNSYDDATVRTCIDVIAKNAAKLRPQHVRKIDGKASKTDSNINNLLSVRPNEFMSAYDFLYKIITQLYCYNNAFVYISIDGKGNVLGLYPLNYNDVELREYQNQMYCRFNFMRGRITVPYTDLIHLRKHFNRNEIFGESNETVLKNPLNILNTVKQALENAVKNCTKLRGYLKFIGVVRPEDQKQILNDFTEKFVSSGKATGIASIDSKVEYNQLTSNIQTADHSQMNYCRQDIYRYFNLSEKIVMSTFNEEEWIAFYESVIEPLAIQLSQEFTAKLFTEREKGFGNEVVFATNRLEYTSLKSKVAMAQVLQQTGLLTVNEFREIFGFPPVDDGDKRFVSLNYVDSKKQNKYQIGEDDADNGTDKERV